MNMTFISGLEEFVQRDVPLRERTWFKLGGSAEYFANPGSIDALTTLVTRCREEELSVPIARRWFECPGIRSRGIRRGCLYGG